MCDQKRLRSVCAYAQSDQNLCFSLEYSMTVKLLTEHHLEFLNLKGGCTDSSESTLVKMSHCWKSHVMAHIIFYLALHLLVLSTHDLCKQFEPRSGPIYAWPGLDPHCLIL